jgi:hypothetical protein
VRIPKLSPPNLVKCAATARGLTGCPSAGVKSPGDESPFRIGGLFFIYRKTTRQKRNVIFLRVNQKNIMFMQKKERNAHITCDCGVYNSRGICWNVSDDVMKLSKKLL